MPAHIRGCDAKSARSVDQGRRVKKNVSRSLTPAVEDARPQITALRQPYMFTIGAGAGQRGTQGGQ